jgi:hypothetical protein
MYQHAITTKHNHPVYTCTMTTTISRALPGAPLLANDIFLFFLNT